MNIGPVGAESFQVADRWRDRHDEANGHITIL